MCVCVCAYRQYSVGFEMVTVSTHGDPGPAASQKKNSGDYRYRAEHLHSLGGVTLKHINLYQPSTLASATLQDMNVKCFSLLRDSHLTTDTGRLKLVEKAK